MPRKRKAPESENGQTNGAAAPGVSAASTAGDVPAEAAPKKKRAPRRRKRAAAAASQTSTDTAPVEISDEAIRLRAYFIAEERLRRSAPGDSESDWLEARRQLLAEQTSR
ncbi:MAG: hypothetical protein DLM52_02450 [Chthoniobacterales bacterium]|nr:MAG: hypothetical protein DLM52_02450 [Chthoniobacterales bacterium]